MVDSLSKLVRSLEVGKEVSVKLIRRGEGEMSLKVKIGEMPEEGEMGMAAQEKAELGLTVQDISPEMARRFRLSASEGVIVAEVEPGSPADRAGLQPRDIITEVNGKAIKDVNDYNKAIASLKEGENIVLLIRRGEYTIFQVIKPGKKEK
jgi:serine protease Do